MNDEPLNRKQHLQWAKQRAEECLARNDQEGAFSGFISDLLKHPELKGHVALQLGMMLRLSGNLGTDEEVRHWFEGFN